MPGPGVLLLTFVVVVATLAGLFAARDRITRKLGRYSARVRREDAIKHIYMCQLDGRSWSLESLAGRLEVPRGRAARILSELSDMGLVHMDATGLLLTSEGERVGDVPGDVCRGSKRASLKEATLFFGVCFFKRFTKISSLFTF